MSIKELKERHVAAEAAVNALRSRLRQKRQQLLDTDSIILFHGCSSQSSDFDSLARFLEEALDPKCVLSFLQ